MGSTAFTPLQLVHLSSPGRLLPSSCCPDKDLFVILSRLGGVDRISLWNSTSGARIWEIDLGDEDNNSYVAGLAWSPDNQTIALVHEPPMLSFLSIQDGHRQMVLPLNAVPTAKNDMCAMKGIWWFSDETKATGSTSIPDIFRRGEMITGTALPTLKYLPFLDGLREDSEKTTATDLFAFQGSNVRSTQKSLPPEVIGEWPTLMVDSTVASIGSSSHKSSTSGGGSKNEAETSNSNSILLVSDNLGHIYYFLDGCFPLGIVALGSQSSLTSAIKHPGQPEFLVHLYSTVGECNATNFWPVAVKMPLVGDRKARDLALLSSVARELVWYTMRVVKEMRAAWFGSEANGGARELGPKWIRALEAKQMEQFGQEEPSPILDLTCLLLTGRASESLVDFLGSGELMSERGIQKWESTMTEALTKLRDYSEKRVSPACQRLHLVLEELRGWALLPQQYREFELSRHELDTCLDFTSKAIIIASWLASVARRELSRFREFISWLRFESSVVNAANDNATPRHDILEVNNYFMSGLVVSSIDKWFMGPVPQFRSCDLGIPGEDALKLASVIDQAHTVLNDPTTTASQTVQTNITPKDLSHLDRNLDALVQELAIRCQQVFIRAAGAACRSATASPLHDSSGQMQVMGYSSQSEICLLIRERTIINERGEVRQFLVYIPTEESGNLLGAAKLSYTTEASGSPFAVSIALLECYLPEEEQEETVHDLELLEAEFLDDECVVIIYRLRDNDYATTYIAILDYSNDLEYHTISSDIYENVHVREDLMQEALKHWKEGKLYSARLPIKRRRALRGCRDGPVYLAVNEKLGRRVACVLDNGGTTVEIFDLEEDGEDVVMDEDSQ
ncbi:anaphase-promoting complex, cyclosome, subunit 4-domain-containing protein [Cyathus striatus]|nr:anaphase-promoting complex, cyclosome, subunit 4-domain-containing protein [Cyathus striatus]